MKTFYVEVYDAGSRRAWLEPKDFDDMLRYFDDMLLFHHCINSLTTSSETLEGFKHLTDSPAHRKELSVLLKAHGYDTVVFEESISEEGN